MGTSTYWSSRWSVGNRFFRDSVGLAADGIPFRKRRLLGSNEEHSNYRAVASIRVKNGVFLSNLSIETSGGSQPIFINGLWNRRRGGASRTQYAPINRGHDPQMPRSFRSSLSAN